MSRAPSKIWTRMPADLMKRIRMCVDAACDQLLAGQVGYIFLRADDVAVPGIQFYRLMQMFAKYHVALCLAVVPAWLTPARWRQLNDIGRHRAHLWCWHQHGWRHFNHQMAGKKLEFGPKRTQAAIENDIIRGRQRLEDLIGRRFYPVFTPPWNRCDFRTLKLIQKYDYLAVSTGKGSGGPLPDGLTNFYVNVDLHTRKEANPAAGWNNLFEELKAAISSGYCGIMIHHQRMNDAAYEFLEILFKAILAQKKLQLVHFEDLVHLKKVVRFQVSGVSKPQA